jgi:iron(III) transport system substrate-binding protein
VSPSKRTGKLIYAGVLFAFACGLTLLFQSSSAAENYESAKREGKLVLYTDQVGEIAEKVIAGFKEKYPGIDVDYYRGDTTEVSQRLETEAAAGRQLVDVITGTVRRSRLIPQDLLASYASPELANYPSDLNPPHHRWSVYSVSLTSLAWNTRLVPAGQEPKDWNDLLDPKWIGKIGMQDPLQGGGAASWFATMYVAWGEQRWSEYMRKLGAQQIRYGRYLQVQDMLGGGEVLVMAAAYPDYLQSSLKAKGAPVEWGVSNPVVRTGLAVDLISHAPHPNAGRLFVDYMLSRDAQRMSAQLGRLPALQSEWPPAFDRLKAANFIDSADEVESQRADFFKEKLKEFFGRR